MTPETARPSPPPPPSLARLRRSLSFRSLFRAKLKYGFVINFVRPLHSLQPYAQTQGPKFDHKRALSDHGGRFPYHAPIAEYPGHDLGPFTMQSLIAPGRCS
jgi:hypothetical protein